MVGSGQDQEEYIGSQRQDQFLNLERRKDHEVSVHTTHTSRSQSQGKSYTSYEENTRSMQLEIDHLHRRLCYKQRRRTPSNSNPSSDDDKGGSYRPRSRTPPSESFSYFENRHSKRRSKSPSREGLSNDAMSRALNQISKSLFTRRIEGRKLPRQFTQPTFTMYNGKTDPMNHVSHFNQKMAIHSWNKALMCKVFPSNLGPVVIRWFDDLKEGFISSFKDLTRAFGARFVTSSRNPQLLDSLLSITMREGETLKIYSDRY